MNLLLEIGTEELPAHSMPGLLKDLKDKAAKSFAELRLNYDELKTLGTPRRLALIAKNLSERQEDVKTESKGPSEKIAYDEQGNLTKAAIGFARGKKIAPENLIKKDGYVYAVVEEKGQDTRELLPELLKKLISDISLPNSMRWADYSFRFLRPLRFLTALYGKEVIPFEVAGVKSGRVSRGHRFLSEGDFEIDAAENYEQRCEENFVIVNQEKRKEIIRRQIEEVAAEKGGVAEITEDLLEEVLYLVEYPTALCGSFDEKYLRLPPEAVITPMRDHQRYFPVKTKEGKLMPLFITVRNGGKDFIDTVRHGNERVLKARLEDAEFFFNEDRKKSLAEHRDKLKTVVYQEGLGNVYEKTERLIKLAEKIAAALCADERTTKNALRAAMLSKADLVTGMVTEFTELQGIMGREYALLDGEDEKVALAIDEHYKPRFAEDNEPTTREGRILSLADKIDAIVGTFSRGKIPTGSQDPFGLRRQALGLVKMLIEAKENVSLRALTDTSMDLYGITDAAAREKMQKDVAEFIRLRLKNVFEKENIRYDAADAALADVDNPYGVYLRAKAVAEFVKKETAEKIIQSFVRVGNIAGKSEGCDIDENAFVVDAERSLYGAYKKAAAEFAVLGELTEETCGKAIEIFAELSSPIDNFFDKVMVMDKDENLRRNRLALLKSIDTLLCNVADFSKIVF